MINAHERSWLTVETHAKREIERHRERLEASGLDLAATEFLRGQIAALRGVLKLAEQESEGTVTRPFSYMDT